MNRPSGAPMLHFPAVTISVLRQLLEENGSAMEAATLLREAGYRAGEGFMKAWEESVRARGEDQSAASLPPDEFWTSLSEFFQGSGWGTLRFLALHAGVGAVDSSDWMEADALARSAFPGCHFTTGVLADLLQRTSGAEAAVMEIECRSHGDARCRFLFGSPETLDSVYDRMRAGLSCEAAVGELG